jgi:hypothetical protein
VPETCGGLRLLGEAHGRAHLVGNGGADILDALLVGVGDPGEQRDPLLPAALRERREGPPGGSHSLVHVCLGADRDLVHCFFGCRIDDGAGLLGRGIDPGAVDVEFRAIDHVRDLSLRFP